MKPTKPKKTNSNDELNVWQPTSDLMSALMYILMLVVLLLGLYLMHIPENTELDPYPGDEYNGEDWDGGDIATPTPTITPDYDGGWGGGWDGGGYSTPVPTPEVTPTATPTVTPTYYPISGYGGGGGGGNGGGDGPGDNPDSGVRSAVYVMLIDAETERTIKEADVEFELYMSDGALQILNTYYPERISYRSFLTRESGTFYFPEKLLQGTYTLHEITEPEGYDAAPNQTFVLDDMYDWPDPYVVHVPVYPSRNVIRVQMTDAETGLAVSGGSFDVISKDDVITPDGTLRYYAGQVVSSIECNEEGYGVSEEIYLGQYIVRQSDIPEYYASYDEEFEVTVDKKSDIAPPLNTIANERTKITINLTDELYPTRGLEGVTFTVRTDNAEIEPFDVVADSRGCITMDTLAKNTSYRILQSSALDNYQPDTDVHTVSVSALGRISGDATTTLDITNRMIRVALGITDEFSNVQVPGVNLALYNQNDELLNSWTTTGTSIMMNNLREGSYYLIKDGDMEKRYNITVHDQAKIQTINIYTTYVMQYVVIGVAAFTVLAVIIVLSIFIRKRKKAAK